MYRLCVLAGLLILAIVVSSAVHAEDRDKPKSISAIMKKAHAGDEAFRAAVTRALKDKDFEGAGTTLKAWTALASQLGSFDPPKGRKESWERLTRKYAKDVKALSGAVDDKDTRAANAALKTINTSCGSCHKSHKGK